MKLGAIIPQALVNLFSKPATRLFPFEESKVAEKTRGKVKFTQSLCIGCKLCMKDCPAAAIEIVKVADKKFKMVYHIDKCIYCAQCVYTCPKKALEMTENYALADGARGQLTEEQGEILTAPPAAEQPPAVEKPAAAPAPEDKK